MFRKGFFIVCMPCGSRGEHGQLETPKHPIIYRILIALGIANSCSENAPSCSMLNCLLFRLNSVFC